MYAAFVKSVMANAFLKKSCKNYITGNHNDSFRSPILATSRYTLGIPKIPLQHSTHKSSRPRSPKYLDLNNPHEPRNPSGVRNNIPYPQHASYTSDTGSSQPTPRSSLSSPSYHNTTTPHHQPYHNKSWGKDSLHKALSDGTAIVLYPRTRNSR